MPIGMGCCRSCINFAGVISSDRYPLVRCARRLLSLWLLWIAANVVGGTLSLVLYRMLFDILGALRLTKELTILGVFFGFLPLFVSQSLALRRHLRKGSWVLASSLVLCIGFYAWFNVNSLFGIIPAIAAMAPPKDLQVLGVLVDAELFWERALSLFVVWGLVGVAQWLVLRRYIGHAGWWVVASAVGGAASGTAAVIVESASGDLLLSWVARWGVYGALTGVVLVLLLQNRIRHRYQRHIERAAVSWSASWPGLDAYTHGKTQRQGPQTKHRHLTDTGPDRTVGARLSSQRSSIRVYETRRTPGAVSRK